MPPPDPTQDERASLGTERDHQDRGLHAAEILESITEGFFGLDRQWRYVYVNREAERILSLQPGELIGRNLWDSFPGLLGSPFERLYRDAMDRRVAGSVEAWYPDHRRWYDVHAYPARNGISIYFRDVTEQRRADAERKALAEEADRQRRIYEVALSGTPDLIYIFDLDHRFIYANDSLLQVWGVPREQAMGKSFLDLGYPQWEAEMHDREIEQIKATKQPINGEVQFDGATGRRVWDYIFAPVLGADGEVVAIAGSARDTTERRATEQALQAQSKRLQEADRAKDEFIATLSHELRNPLAPLRNSVALLKRTGGDPARAARVHDVMERQLDHLVRLVDDLLEISRVSRGDFALQRERTDLATVVRHALESSAAIVQARRHRLAAAFPPAPLWVDADAVRLAQVVSNLVDNAAKYTPEGGRIDVGVAAADAATATVRVRDDGAGIAQEARDRIFEMFNRGERSQMRGEGGLGIGLALARRLAEMHGASLQVASEGPGKGSEFTLRIPLVEAPQAAPASHEEPGRVDAKRILVVDDNHDAAETLSMLLEDLGAEVRVARDGLQALELYPQFAPSAVLLDIGMPGMDGYAVARTLRARYPDHRTPLIALTGWGQEQDRTRAREAGFDHHIVKPAELRALQALIASL
ncbi:MAG: hybrid sensor histidine kinase/response regulator [Ramlibacter sp.]